MGIQNIINWVKFIIEGKFPDLEFELIPYGSSMTDLMTPFSDLDLSIVTEDSIT